MAGTKNELHVAGGCVVRNDTLKILVIQTGALSILMPDGFLSDLEAVNKREVFGI